MKQNIWIEPRFENGLGILLPVESNTACTVYLTYEENKNIFEGIGGILIKAKCIPLSQSYKFYQTLKKKTNKVLSFIFLQHSFNRYYEPRCHNFRDVSRRPQWPHKLALMHFFPAWISSNCLPDWLITSSFCLVMRPSSASKDGGLSSQNSHSGRGGTLLEFPAAFFHSLDLFKLEPMHFFQT